MVLPSDQAGPVAGVGSRPLSRAGHPAAGWDTAALMSLCLRISLVLWTGLIAGVALSWHFVVLAGGVDGGVSGTAYIFHVSQDPVFRTIFFGSLLLHTVLAIEGGLRWDELHAKAGFLAACSFLLFAKIERSLPFAEPSAGDSLGGPATLAAATDWSVLTGLMASAATVSFLLVLLSLSVGRPIIAAPVGPDARSPRGCPPSKE
jgi:hypothetical protein